MKQLASSAGWGEYDSQGFLGRPNRYVARQTIFGCNGTIHGYELLFREGPHSFFSGDSDSATRIMIDNGMLHGFESISGCSLTFINCTRESLVDGLVTLLPSKWTVLELLETIEPDREVISACHDLRRLGYRISLDDFHLTSKTECLVEIADYVKVDFRIPLHEWMATSRQLEATPIKRVAEKIETSEELQMAQNEGFELFQGYFLAHPTLFSRFSPPATSDRHFPETSPYVPLATLKRLVGPWRHSERKCGDGHNPSRAGGLAGCQPPLMQQNDP